MASTTETMLHRLRHEREEKPVGSRFRRFNFLTLAVAGGLVASAFLAYNLAFGGDGSGAFKPNAPATPGSGAEPANNVPVVSPAESGEITAQATAAVLRSSEVFWKLAADTKNLDRTSAVAELSKVGTESQVTVWVNRLNAMKVENQANAGTTDDHFKVLSQDESVVVFEVCSSSHIRTIDTRTNAVIGEDPHDYNRYKAEVVKGADGSWKVQSITSPWKDQEALCTP